MPTTASRASPTSGSGRPVRLGAACTVGSSGGSAMRRCGRSASRRAFSRGSTRGRRTFASAGATGGGAATPRVRRSPLWREAVRDGADRTCGAGRCGRRVVWGASPTCSDAVGSAGVAAGRVVVAGSSVQPSWRAACCGLGGAVPLAAAFFGAGFVAATPSARTTVASSARPRLERGLRRAALVDRCALDADLGRGRLRCGPLGADFLASTSWRDFLAAFFGRADFFATDAFGAGTAAVTASGLLVPSSTGVIGSAPMSGVERRLARSPDARAAPAASAPWRAAISAPSRCPGCAARPGSRFRRRR